MRGYRNMLLVGFTVLCLTFLGYHGIRAGSDLAGMSAVLLAVGGTAVGAAYARGFNKKHEHL